MLKIGIIGGGQTGRGFLAQLLAPYSEFVFVDINRTLVNELEKAGKYTVSFFDDSMKPVVVSNFRAYIPLDAITELKSCDAVFISVRAENTYNVGLWLHENRLDSIPTVVCENASDPAGLIAGIGINASSGAIFCTTVENGIDINSEGFPFLYAASEFFPEKLKSFSCFKLTNDFKTLMERKLYTYNAASGIIAYLGAAKGYDDYAEAANDPDISDELEQFYSEINKAVCSNYGIDIQEQESFALLSKKKFQNKAIRDTILRNAAAPIRKLGPKERLIEPMRLIISQGGNADPLYKTAAAALKYAGAKDKSAAKAILLEASGMEETDKRVENILDCFEL